MSKRIGRLACRISRKVGQPNFGSIEVSHSIETEVEFEDTREFLEKAAKQRRLISRMVEEGIAENDRNSRPARPARMSPGADAPDPTMDRQGGSRDGGTGQNSEDEYHCKD